MDGRGRWPAFPNCANFRPHMSVNLSKTCPLLVTGRQLPPHPPTPLCCSASVFYPGLSLFAPTSESSNNGRQPARSFAGILKSRVVLQFYTVFSRLLFQFLLLPSKFKSSATRSQKCEQNAACARQGVTFRPCSRARKPFPISHRRRI